MAIDPYNIGIQKNEKELAKTTIVKLKSPLVSMVYTKIFQHFKV